MNRLFTWSSGVFDEISLVYQKADENENLQKALSALENQALAEVNQNYSLLPRMKKLKQQKVQALPPDQKEQLIAGLGNLGLLSLEATLTEPIIRVRFSPMFPAVMGCTIFSVLNRLEKLDGAINMLFPKMTLELYVPLGGKKGLFQWELLIMQLYPWLSVSELSANYAAAAAPVSAAPAEPAQPTQPASKAEPRGTGQAGHPETKKKTGFLARLFHRRKREDLREETSAEAKPTPQRERPAVTNAVPPQTTQAPVTEQAGDHAVHNNIKKVMINGYAIEPAEETVHPSSKEEASRILRGNNQDAAVKENEPTARDGVDSPAQIARIHAFFHEAETQAKKSEPVSPKPFPRELSFSNRDLHNNTKLWEGPAWYYIDENTRRKGTLSLSVDRAYFVLPEREGYGHFAYASIPLKKDAISIRDNVLIVNGERDRLCFLLPAEGSDAVVQWLQAHEKDYEAIELVGSYFLDCFNAVPHPFIEARGAGGEAVAQLLQFIRKRVGGFSPFGWEHNVSWISFNAKAVSVNIESGPENEESYYENEKTIEISVSSHAWGFFDDSGHDYDLEIKITQADPADLQKPNLRMEQEAARQFFDEHEGWPEHEFYVENLFGLKGWFRILVN